MCLTTDGRNAFLLFIASQERHSLGAVRSPFWPAKTLVLQLKQSTPDISKSSTSPHHPWAIPEPPQFKTHCGKNAASECNPVLVQILASCVLFSSLTGFSLREIENQGHIARPVCICMYISTILTNGTTPSLKQKCLPPLSPPNYSWSH